jgi:NTE family protein
MSGKRIGLALSGGIARGPAHLGVLQALERAGLHIDCVAGVSAGALVGALYCAGIVTERALKLLRYFGWRTISRLVWPRRGFFSFSKLERWLANLLGEVRFEDLKRPFAVIVTDLQTWEPVILRSGRLAPAVHASCVPPGFVEPVQIDGRWYCDGGASQNLPVTAARE